MMQGDYDDFFTILLSQQWIIPYYRILLALQSTASILLFFFTAKFLLYKAKVYCIAYRRALVYTILFPTVMNIFIGFIYSPYFILPYDVVWSCGFFIFRNAAGYFLLISCVCFLPYLLSLFYVGLIYFRAFTDSGRLKVPPKMERIFFCIIGLVTLSGSCLFYWGFSSGQEEKQLEILLADPQLAGLFLRSGGFVLSIADYNFGFVTLLVIAGIVSCISFLAIWAAIILMILAALKRKKLLSKATYHMQNTFLAVGFVHIWIYVAYICTPAAIVVFSLYLRPAALKRYSLAPLLVLFFQCLSPCYCLLYLSVFSRARQRLWRFMFNKK